MTTPGPHLLGRIPSPPDERDYRLENFLGLGTEAAAADPVALATDAAYHLKLTTITYKRWAATQYADIKATHWWQALNDLATIINPPAPPPTGNVVWDDPQPVLDQGDFGTCVGNGCAQWGNTLPINDQWDETVARAIYYEATVLDGAPDDPDAANGGQQGATVRSGVKALKNRGRLGTYAVTTSIDTVGAWIDTKGPVIFGTNWTADMFKPDAAGQIYPTGKVEGGHCYIARGNLNDEGVILFRNSWGASWGLGGDFKMSYKDAQTLLSQQGEGWTAVELAI